MCRRPGKTYKEKRKTFELLYLIEQPEKILNEKIFSQIASDLNGQSINRNIDRAKKVNKR